MKKMLSIFILLFCWLNLLTTNIIFWISFDNIIKNSVIKFFAEWKINKIYFDNFKYEGQKIAENFFPNNKKITNKILLTRNNWQIKIEEYIKINKEKIKNTLYYLLNILNKNYNYNKKITNYLIEIKWNTNDLNYNWKQLFLSYYKVLKENIWWKDLFLYNYIKNKLKKEWKEFTNEEEMKLFYKNIYELSLKLNMIWDYILYKNKDKENLKDNLLQYINGKYLYKLNNSMIKDILYKYDIQNNTNLIRYLNLFNWLNN